MDAIQTLETKVVAIQDRESYADCNSPAVFT